MLQNQMARTSLENEPWKNTETGMTDQNEEGI
jgi:hypothetical protein